MIEYKGLYIEKNGSMTPFSLVAEGSKLKILYAEEGKEKVKTIRIAHNAKWVWKLNEKSISCSDITRMIERFKKNPAYARATFRYYCR